MIVSTSTNSMSKQNKCHETDSHSIPSLPPPSLPPSLPPVLPYPWPLHIIYYGIPIDPNPNPKEYSPWYLLPLP